MSAGVGANSSVNEPAVVITAMTTNRTDASFTQRRQRAMDTRVSFKMSLESSVSAPQRLHERDTPRRQAPRARPGFGWSPTRAQARPGRPDLLTFTAARPPTPAFESS